MDKARPDQSLNFAAAAGFRGCKTPFLSLDPDMISRQVRHFRAAMPGARVLGYSTRFNGFPGPEVVPLRDTVLSANAAEERP